VYGGLPLEQRDHCRYAQSTNLSVFSRLLFGLYLLWGRRLALARNGWPVHDV